MNLNQQHLMKIWDAAIEAVHPQKLMKQHIVLKDECLQITDIKLSLKAIDNIYLIGAGKASGAMAAQAAEILGRYLTDSLITIKHGHEIEGNINMVTASHPVPDQHSVDAVTATVKFLEKVKENDIVLCLLSGGASSLWCDIPFGLDMKSLSETYSLLINSGAAIDEVNTVRKHLSQIKGGQLVRHCKGKLITLAISDVPGDDLGIVGSGPTFPDSSTFADAIAILSRYKIFDNVPQNVTDYLKKGANGLIAETPKPNDALFAEVTNKIIGANQIAVTAAAKMAKSLGFNVYLTDYLITGETQEEAQRLIHKVLDKNFIKPYCIIQGGETVINVTGNGKGGRNQHFALVALAELAKIKFDIVGEVSLLSAGTDGTDGPTDAAGAIIDMKMPDSVEKAGIAITAYLESNDAYHFFERVGGLLRTGPTQTNVMDIQILMVN